MCGARPDKSTCDLHVMDPFNCFSLPVFPLLFLPKSPKPLPFPTTNACPKHPINPVWFQTAFPLHPTTYPTPRQQLLLVWKRAAPNDLSWWISCLDTGAGGSAATALWRARTRWWFLWSPQFRFPPVIMHSCASLVMCIWALDGLMAPVMA